MSGCPSRRPGYGHGQHPHPQGCPSVATAEPVRNVLHLPATVPDQLRGPPAAVVFDHPHAAKPADAAGELPAFCLRQRQREHPGAAGEPGGVLLLERDRRPGRRPGRASCGTGGTSPRRSCIWPRRPRGGAPTGPAPGTGPVRATAATAPGLPGAASPGRTDATTVPGSCRRRKCRTSSPPRAGQGLPGPGTAGCCTPRRRCRGAARPEPATAPGATSPPGSPPRRTRCAASPGSWCRAGLTQQLCQLDQHLMPYSVTGGRCQRFASGGDGSWVIGSVRGVNQGL